MPRPIRLTGGAGNDRLDGGLGNDTMMGGTGDDVYVVNATGDKVIEGGDEGTDTVLSTVSYALGANIENLNLQGTRRSTARAMSSTTC